MLYFIIPLYKPILLGSQSYIKYSNSFSMWKSRISFSSFPLFHSFSSSFFTCSVGLKPEASHTAGKHSATEQLISPASLFWQGSSKQPKGLKLVLQPRQALSCNPPGQSLKWGFSIESFIFPLKTYCSDLMNYRTHH